MAHCFSCGEGGDLISIFAAVRGLDDTTAFKAFKDEYAPGAKSAPKTPQAPVRRAWQPTKAEPAPALWQERATEFVRHSMSRLESNPSVLAQLESWGLSAEAARTCMIGWNDVDKSVPRESWGLEPMTGKDGRPKKVWLPEGLVLPMLVHGRVVKIKIRRPNEALQRLLPELRYWEVPGSAKIFHRYGREASTWVIVETERDAAMIWSKVRDLGIGAMATGGASKRPDAKSAATLGTSELILNALDGDQAGAINTARFWSREFPQCLRWPTPPGLGKDAGDAFGAGLDIRAWVLAGLPTHIRRTIERRKQPGRTLDAAPQIAAPGVKEAPYRQWYVESCEQFLALLAGSPIKICSSRGVPIAPTGWSLEPDNWTKLRRVEAMLREAPIADLVIEAGGQSGKTVDIHDLTGALPRLREWIGGENELQNTTQS